MQSRLCTVTCADSPNATKSASSVTLGLATNSNSHTLMTAASTRTKEMGKILYLSSFTSPAHFDFFCLRKNNEVHHCFYLGLDPFLFRLFFPFFLICCRLAFRNFATCLDSRGSPLQLHVLRGVNGATRRAVFV